MSTFNLIILGIIQGLTEFLPISSSGHIELGKAILQDDQFGKITMATTVVLHVATALSTLVVFRKEIQEIIRGLFQFKWNQEFIFSAKIVLSMIPAAIVGVLMKDELEALFDKNVLLVGAMLIVTAILLLFADRAKSTNKEMGWLDAFVVGLAQMVALLPGISRSGATISTSVFLGIDREKAARFSFLMVVPLILGYVAKELLFPDGDLVFQRSELVPLAAGFVAAFLTGCLACKWMIELVKRAKLTFFSIYCLIVGATAIAYGLLVKTPVESLAG